MERPNLNLLVRAVLEDYTLPWDGFHGVGHWARVLENGLRLAESTRAVVEVVQLFAVFHDSRRVNESSDPGHGLRGAELAVRLRGTLYDLPDAQFALLYEACAGHTDGLTDANITMQTCWDADRLDLGRVGMMVYLPACTVPEDRPAKPPWWWNYPLAVILPFPFVVLAAPVVLMREWLGIEFLPGV
jgi:uncharacterized protein